MKTQLIVFKCIFKAFILVIKYLLTFPEDIGRLNMLTCEMIEIDKILNKL